VAQRHWNLVWDIGCNVGRFSRIAAQNARLVLALDSDEQAIERLYQELRAEGHRSILPLVADVTDLTPNRGWRGRERRSLIARARPELVLCLALIHHLVLGMSVPLREVVDWLASLCQHVVLEFVTRDDPKVAMLLRHKDEQYEDYSLDHFEECFGRRFELLDRQVLSSRTRILYHGRIRNSQSG
jgi:precorrin-6B methylase 2